MITVAWDVDDVLNDLMRAWLEQGWRPQHPDCQLRFEDIRRNPPHEIIGTTFQKYHDSLDDFRLSPAYPAMQAQEQVLKWLQKKGALARHLALTAVPVKAAHVSAQWVMKNFSPWIRSFNFVPSLRPDETIPLYDKTKADFLKRLGKVDVLVEDNPENARQAQDAGIKALLIAKPWNDSRLSLGQVLQELDKLI